uniref:Uncharacterized protein n=1 Tax=viral metagenome TaxID=1070528 RepID=A0A6C0CT59_9ZZZZ
MATQLIRPMHFTNSYTIQPIRRVMLSNGYKSRYTNEEFAGLFGSIVDKVKSAVKKVAKTVKGVVVPVDHTLKITGIADSRTFFQKWLMGVPPLLQITHDRSDDLSMGHSLKLSGTDSVPPVDGDYQVDTRVDDTNLLINFPAGITTPGTKGLITYKVSKLGQLADKAKSIARTITGSMFGNMTPLLIGVGVVFAIFIILKFLF